jgi:hypothetical protein
MTKVKDLQKSGDVMSQLIEWNPRNWEVPKLAMFETQISKFASRCQTVGGTHVILRGEVIEFSETMEDVFIGAMIFGYGLRGYGPSRVGRVIRENRDLIANLNRQYESAAEGPATSWHSHTKQDMVKYFGPAFATKFAYFAARHQKAKGVLPLIADLNTSWAMWWLAEIPRSVERDDSYLAYVELAHAWGTEIAGGYGVDEIERAIFELGKGWSKKLN